MATPRKGKRKFGEKAEFGEGQSSFGESMARPREGPEDDRAKPGSESRYAPREPHPLEVP